MNEYINPAIVGWRGASADQDGEEATRHGRQEKTSGGARNDCKSG